MGKSRHQYKCIASLSCEEGADLCDKEAEYPKKEHDMRYAGLSDNVTRKYCKLHWDQLKSNNGEFICIGVETAENGSCQLIDAKGTGRNIILKGDIGENAEGKKVCNATSPKSVRGGSVYGVSVRSSSPYGIRSPRSPGSVVLSPMTFNSAGSPVVRAGSVRGPASVRSGTTIVGTKPAGSIKSKKMKKDEESDSSDSDSDTSSVSTDSSSDSDSSDSDSSCGDSLSETSSISSCEDDDVIKNRRKSKKRKTKLKTSGISKRKRKALMKRNYRPAPPFTREKNPPIINIKYELAKKLVVIDSTYDIDEAMNNMASFINIIHSQNEEDEHNKDYSYVVTEDVVDKVAKLLRKFMYNPLRIEMVLGCLFDYETRDQTVTFDFYGFKTPRGKTTKTIAEVNPLIYQSSPIRYGAESEFTPDEIRSKIEALKNEYEKGPKFSAGPSYNKMELLFKRLDSSRFNRDVNVAYEEARDLYNLFKEEYSKNNRNANIAEQKAAERLGKGEKAAAAAAAALVVNGPGGPMTQLPPNPLGTPTPSQVAGQPAPGTPGSFIKNGDIFSIKSKSRFAKESLTNLISQLPTNFPNNEKTLLTLLSNNLPQKLVEKINKSLEKNDYKIEYDSANKFVPKSYPAKLLHNYALLIAIKNALPQTETVNKKLIDDIIDKAIADSKDSNKILVDFQKSPDWDKIKNTNILNPAVAADTLKI